MKECLKEFFMLVVMLIAFITIIAALNYVVGGVFNVLFGL